MMFTAIHCGFIVLALLQTLSAAVATVKGGYDSPSSCCQIETYGSPDTSNCPDIQIALMDVLQQEVLVDTDHRLSCSTLDETWDDIIDAPNFSGLYYDGDIQASTFEELVAFNYGEAFLITGWEYSNPVAFYGEHFARVTFDLTISTECKDEDGNNIKYTHEQCQFLAYCRGAENRITELHGTHIIQELKSMFVVSQGSSENSASCAAQMHSALNGTFPPPASICYHV